MKRIPKAEWRPTFEQTVGFAAMMNRAGGVRCFIQDICGHLCKSFHSRIVEHVRNNRFAVVLIPTGHGKTQVVTIDMVCRESIRNPNTRILVVAHGATYAYELSDEIRQTLASGELKRYYGDLVGVPWTREKVNLRHRTSRSKEPTIQFVGAGQDIEGGHFDWIIMDDVVTRSGAASETERKKLKAWFSTVLMKRIDPDTRLTVIGTRYNPLDLYGHLSGMGRTVLGEVRVLRMGALLLDGQIADPALSPEDLEGLKVEGRLTTLWPRETINGRRYGYTVDDMIAERRVDGPIYFGLARQNNVELAKGQIFEGKYFRWYRDLPEDALSVFSGVDAPVKSKEENDFFALISVAVTPNGRIYILPGIVKDRRKLRQMVDVTIERHAANRARYPRAEHRTVIEGVQGQYWLYELVVERFELDPKLRRQWEMRDEFGWTVPDRDKTQRAWWLSGVFQDRAVYFPDTPQGHELAENLERFPDVEHDDDFDALEIALKRAREVEFDRPHQGAAVPQSPGSIDGYEFEEMMACKHAQAEGEHDGEFKENWWFVRHED